MFDDRQVSRLRRHYESVLNTYDEVSLLDFSHILRIFVDGVEELMESADFNSTTAFSTAAPSRPAVRRVSGGEFLFCYFPQKTMTNASEGRVVEAPGAERGGTIGALAGINENSQLFVTGLHYSTVELDGSLDSNLFTSPRISSVSYQEWLGAEVVRLKVGWLNGDAPLSISRSMIINRVANSLGGSHPEGESSELNNNRFDAPIRHLLEFKIGGLPLPYFVLLNVAQEILKKFD